MSMDGLGHGENRIRGVVLFQVMRNLVEGSTRVRVPRTGAGTRATGMRSGAMRVQAKSRFVVMVEVVDLGRGRGRGCDLSRTGRRHVT